MKKILIVEDDPKLAKYLVNYIKKYDFSVRAVEDFSNIVQSFQAFNPHLVLLDINLPVYDGFYWCRQIRQLSTCPIIFISARTGDMDQVMALEHGGDDYITKPFQMEVVLAKVKSQLRRAYGEYAVQQKERIVEVYGLKLFVERLELHYHENVISVTKNEALIIEYLIDRYPRVASREELLVKLWDDERFVDENTLNVNIARVRKLFDSIGLKDVVETIRGVGYRLSMPKVGE